MMTLQNCLFLFIILILMSILKDKYANLLKIITIIGLVKLLIPPFLVSDRLNESLSSGTGWIPSTIIYSNVEVNNTPTISLTGYIFILWLSITLTFLLIVLVRHWALYYQFKNIKSLHNSVKSSWLDLNEISLYQSDKIHSPFVIGFFKHKIIVPANWHKWDTQTQSSIIAHEIAHIKAGDHWLNLLKLIVLSTHFYNPLTWIMVRRLTHYSEIVCDEISIQKNKLERKLYANMLLKIAEVTGGRLIGASTLNFSKTHQLIKTRIIYQLNYEDDTIIKTTKFLNKLIIPMLLLLMILFSWQYNVSSVKQESKLTEIFDVMEFYAVDKKPEIITKMGPELPEEARKAGIEGLVVVSIVIGKDGKVIDTTIFKSATDFAQNAAKVVDSKKKEAKKFTEDELKIARLLDLSAIESAKKLQFTPAEYRDKPVKVKMNIPYHFALK